MTDKKYTDEEIIKALECHINAEDCVGCEMFGRCDEIILTKLVLDLINRQKSENLELKLKVNELLVYKQEVTKNNMKNYEIYKSQKAEIEKLKGSTIVNNIIETQRIKREAKTEAYKEFAEKLSDKAEPDENHYWWIRLLDIDNLLKEMVGK